jgi:hypothetical protein
MAMSDASVRGVVHFIDETKTYGQKGFRKRLVVLAQDNGRFINYVPLEFTQDACDSVDRLSVGDEVDVQYRLSGRKWQKDADSEVKYFLSAEAMQFEVLQRKPEQIGESVNDQLAEASQDEDDIPF